MSLDVTLAVRWSVLGFLVSLAVIIAYRLLTGEINTSGLLRSKSGSAAGSMSPARIQLLLFTIWTAGNYFGRTMGSLGSGRMPEVPESWLVGLGGSHLLYLGTKAYAFLGGHSSPTAIEQSTRQRGE